MLSMSLFAFVYRRLDHDDKTFLECVQFPQSSTAVRKNETPLLENDLNFVNEKLFG